MKIVFIDGIGYMTADRTDCNNVNKLRVRDGNARPSARTDVRKPADRSVAGS